MVNHWGGYGLDNRGRDNIHSIFLQDDHTRGQCCTGGSYVVGQGRHVCGDCVFRFGLMTCLKKTTWVTS